LTGLKFETVASDYEEDMTLDLEPLELAKLLSRGKAEAVAKDYKDSIVIGADTFVVLNNELLGKPHDADTATKMLEKISNQAVSLITGYTIIDTANNKNISETVETKIYIKELSDQEIKGYVATKEPLDKAGAFAIQGIGAIFIKKIEGDFFGAMGLPLFDLSKALKKFGISIL
jgi:septum formation protein